MSFERLGHYCKGVIEFSCDSCGEQVNTGTSDLPEALSEIKSMGWKVVRTPDDSTGWTHFCSACDPRKAKNVFERVKP